MDEDYLASLKTEIDQEQARLDNIRACIDKAIKEMNDARTKKDRLLDSYEKNYQKELDVFLLKSNKLKGDLKILMSEKESFIHGLEVKQADLNLKEKSLEERESQLITRESLLLDKEVINNKKQKELQDMIDDTIEIKEQSILKRSTFINLLDQTNRLFVKVKTQVQTMLAKEEKQSTIFNEREQAIIQREKDYKIRRGILEKMGADIKVEKRKIQSQWQNLLSTKKYLDDELAKRSK